MNKRLTVLLLMLLGAVLLLAHTTHSQIKLHATKIEMNGTVKLTWTKALAANNSTQYTVYRALLPDTSVVTTVTVTADTSFVDVVPPVLSPLPQVFAYKVVATTGVVNEQSNIVFASVPGIPPIGGFRLEGKIDNGKVKLAWLPPAVGNVHHYEVFRGMLGDNGPMHLRIDSTTNLFSITDAPLVLNPNSPITFVFYAKAVLNSGEVIVSTILQLTIHPNLNHDEVKFISKPNPYAQKDVAYQYTAQAVSGDPAAVIRYYVIHSATSVPLTFKIDSVTGVVNWTPAVKGMFKIVIEAVSNKGGRARQEFIVTVAGGNGIIQGKISDKANIGIPNVIVEVYKAENNVVISYAYSAKTDANGNYRLNRIDPGNYKVRANSPSNKYQSVWYDTAREVSQAKLVIVPDSAVGVTQVNMKLRDGFPPTTLRNVTGTVKDSAGYVISGADCRVIFVRAEFALNFGGGMGPGNENFRKYFDFNKMGDFRLEGNSEFVFKTWVDSSGHYSIKLPPGGYIAIARAKGYAVEFFNEQTNLLSADVIKIQNDTSGISFTLSPIPPVVLGAISGSVMDSVNDVAVPARVIAFRDGWRFRDMHRIARVYVTDTDSTGAYQFNDLLPGNYVVMALPLGNYAPAFYSTDTANFRWKFATKVVISESGNSVDDINIYVKQFGPFANGFTSIGGTVSVTGGNGMMNGSVKAGAIVYAIRNGTVAGYSFTNPEGHYIITGLAPGQYTVFVDKAGYDESSSQSVAASYDVNGNPLNGTANFSINAVLNITVNTTVVPEEYTLEQNYPNPFNPSTTIKFSLPQGTNATLKVYNLVGQEVASLINGYKEAGAYTVTFDASRLSSGVYFYRMETGKTSVVKKMLLIK